MSLSATVWAWNQQQVRGSTKLVLLCFADHYNDDRDATWPSAPALAQATGLDIKTIVKCLSELREKGLIRDTGERSGKTNQVIVYELPAVPEYRKVTRHAANSSNPKQTQKRSTSENGAHPLFPDNQPVFPVEPTQKRVTEPLKEPLKESITCGDSPNRPPVCPQKAILDLYHRILPELTHHTQWTEARQKTLQSRWREKPKRQNLEFWEGFFNHIRQSPFLMGRVAPRPGGKPFMADLEWMLKPANFAKIVEGKYHE